MPQACRLELPLPPSLNGAYANVPGRGRVATKALKSWKEAAGWKLQASPRASFAGPFRVVIYLPEKMRGDIDNRIKPCLDLLTTHKVIIDDRFAKAVSVERSAKVPEDTCIVIVETATP